MPVSSRNALIGLLLISLAVPAGAVSFDRSDRARRGRDKGGTPTPTATALPASPTATPPPATPEPLREALAAASTVLHVPGDVATLQAAINQVPNGGIIELAAGTYASPANGWGINDTGRAFTIRAASGATVVLDGGGSRDILRYINSTVGAGRPVTFERLIFRNGATTIAGLAAGVTMQRAQATFDQCRFETNRGDATTGGGGIEVAIGSTAFFFDCVWSDNTSRYAGAAMALEEFSTAYIHRGTFTNNRTNVANHWPSSGGGAIHVGNSTLRVTNSRFEGNQAGYVGGAIYAIGTWTNPVTTPQAHVLVVNSTFINNQAVLDPSVSFAPPTEGGAFHVEDQATGRIINSRFLFNSANTGGAVNAYRAILDISGTLFEGNRATGAGNATGFGGAISAISNDVDEPNRRTASLTVRDSLIRGRSGAVTTVAQTGGCIFAGGDHNHAWGEGGVSQNGTLDFNRAPVLLERVALVDCDVQQLAGAGGSGFAGGMWLAMASLTMRDSLISQCDALGDANTGGGALAILDLTTTDVTNTTFARNTAGQYGGAIFAQGSNLVISGSRMTHNEVSPGTNETLANSYGAVVFSSGWDTYNLPATGSISSSVLSNNIGLAIFDDDRTNGPINDMRYNGNQFYATTFGSSVYTNALGISGYSVSQLNSLVVSRGNGTTTDKATTTNTALGSAPVGGILLGVPPVILPINAVGDSAPPTAAYLAYAWDGGSATLNGNAVSGNAGLTAAPGTGSHVLSVGGTPFSDTIDLGPAPAATFSANPTSISGSQSSTLSWNTTSGTFIEGAIDQAVGSLGAASGTRSVSPLADTTYRMLVVTETGGAVGDADVTVTGATPTINSYTTNLILLPLGGTAVLSWSTSGATAADINGTAAATTGTRNVAPTTTTVYTLNASNGFGVSSANVTVNVNGGSAPLAVPTITAPGSAQVIDSGGITFAWNAVSGASGYDLRVWNSNTGAAVFSGSLSGNGATSTLVTLPSGFYMFGVRACQGNGFAENQCGRFASRVFQVNIGSPSNAPNVTAPAAGANLTQSILTLGWSAVSGSGTLPLYYEVDLTETGSNQRELQILLPSASLSTVTRVHTGSYALRVRACQGGCGPWSATRNFTATIGAPPSAAPTINTAVVSGGNSLAVTWSSVSGAEWYQLYVIQSSGGPGGGAVTVAAREVVGTSISGLPIPAGAASVLVAACTGNGCGPFSSVRSITGGGPNPSAPQLGQPLGGSVVSGPGVLFTWSRVPGDDGTNTTYRLYVQDLSRATAALDVLTTDNFYGAYFKAEGARYDALVVANPGPSQVVGPAVGFVVSGQSAAAPTMAQPTHNSTLPQGNIQLGWSPVPGATLYEYFVAAVGSSIAPTRGVTPGLVVQVPLSALSGAPQLYSGIVRSCPEGASCAPGSDAGWGPWSNQAGPGVTNFTITP
jgi:predicted outer membrane repeat protein